MSITLNPYLMLLVFVTFMLLIYLLNVILYKPMFAYMAKREGLINQDSSSIDKYKKEIIEIDEEINSILDSARKEAASIIDNATQEAKIAYENKIADKRSELEGNFALQKQTLQNESNEIYQDLLSHLPSFESAIKHKLQQI